MLMKVVLLTYPLPVGIKYKVLGSATLRERDYRVYFQEVSIGAEDLLFPTLDTTGF